MALERYRSRASAASMQGLVESAEPPKRPSSKSQESSEIYGVQRRLSDLHSSLRARTLSTGSQASDTNEQDNHCPGTFPASPRMVPDQEQFLDGQATPSVNLQRPGFVRTFSRSASTQPHYDAETTPNMAYLHEEATETARRRSPPPQNRNLSSSEADAAFLEGLECRRRISFGEPNVTAVNHRRSIAQMIYPHSEVRRQSFPHHDKHAACNGEPSRSPAPVVTFREGPRSGTPEFVQECEEEVKRHCSMKAQVDEAEDLEEVYKDQSRGVLSGLETVMQTRRSTDLDELSPAFPPRGPLRVWTPDLKEDEITEGRLQPQPLRIDQTNLDEQHTKNNHRASGGNTIEENDYFGSTIPSTADDLGPYSNFQLCQRQSRPISPVQSSRSRLRSWSPILPRPLPGAASLTPTESNIHPVYRRQTITPGRTIYTEPNSRNFGASRRDAQAETHLSQPPTRCYVRLWRWIQDQPRHYPPDENGETFTANLRNDIAPAHWLLRWLQILTWLAFVIWLLVMVAKLKADKKIPFECYELKTQLRQQASNTTEAQDASPPQNSTSSLPSNATANRTAPPTPKEPFVPSDVSLPNSYLFHNSSTTCVLTPLNHVVLLSNNFTTLFALGVCCCGVAFLIQVLLHKTFGLLMRRSGAYGARTLMVRVIGQGISAGIGAGIVCGMVWGIMRL